MKINKKINIFRRALMKRLTKNIGTQTHIKQRVKDFQIKKILISRPNHRLGNLLLLTPLVQEVIHTFPDSKIDLFIKGDNGIPIFLNYKNIDRIIQLPKKPFSNIFKYFRAWLSLRNRNYDLVINAIEHSSSGKLSTLFSSSTHKFYGQFSEKSQLRYKDYSHSAKYPIYNFRNYLTKFGFKENNRSIPLLNIKLDKEEIENGDKILRSILPKINKQTICLFTNATGDKCYSETWWSEFYEKLKSEFPNYNIIELLPIDNTSRLGFKIPTYFSEDIREMGAFISNTNLFIAADCGVMHLASSVGTSTIGLFSVTNENVYKPYGNKSLSINTNKISYTEIVDLIKIHLNNPFPKRSI